MFTINPAVVREGLFSPEEKDETGKELPLNPHIIHTIFMCITCVSVCVHVFLNMILQISYEREHIISYFSCMLCLVSAKSFVMWHELCWTKLKHDFSTGVRQQREKQKYCDYGCKKVLWGQTKTEYNFHLLRETILSILLVNRGGWVIPLTFQPRLEIRYSISCPQICSVVN